MLSLVILVMFLLIAAAAPRYGVDSRAPEPGRPRRPIDDVRALHRALTRRGVRVVR